MQQKERTCKECGRSLSIYNTNDFCFACLEKQREFVGGQTQRSLGVTKEMRNEGFVFTWPVYKHHIELNIDPYRPFLQYQLGDIPEPPEVQGLIMRNAGQTAPKKVYKPLDNPEEELYVEFLNVNLDPENILSFVNKHGRLGIGDYLLGGVGGEEIDSVIGFQLELQNFKWLADLYEGIRKQDINKLKELIPAMDNEAPDFLLSWAKDSLVEGMVWHLKGINFFPKPTEQGFMSAYECPNLLSTIYLQFYWHVTQRKTFRECRGFKTCRRLFVPSRPNNYWCSDSCKSLHSVRKLRKKRNELRAEFKKLKQKKRGMK